MRFVLKGLLRNIKNSSHNGYKKDKIYNYVSKNNANQMIKSPPNQIIKYESDQNSKLDDESLSKKNYTITNLDLYKYFKLPPEDR